MYGLDLSHKHLPEIINMTGLTRPPVFCPVVCDYFAGIAATIMLHNDMLRGNPSAEDIRRELSDYYSGERYIRVRPELGSGMLGSSAPGSSMPGSGTQWSGAAGSDRSDGTNMLEITVSGNDELTIVTSRFDNLGKGASGAAVQNMELMLGLYGEEGA